MGEFVWLNGGVIPLSEASISPLDRGFLYGDGLFETMRSYQGTIHLLDRHLRRFADGAAVLGLQLPANDDLREALYEVLIANNHADGRIRLTVSRGSSDGSESTLFVRSEPLLQSDGIPDAQQLIVFSRARQLPEIMPRVKSLNYLPEILARREVVEKGVQEGLFLSPDGSVAEGSVSNIFIVKDGRLMTPPLSLGILGGIVRGRVLELAEKEGVPVHEKTFSLAELNEADECFYTNSVREIVPVRAVHAATIGDGVVGEVTQLLYNSWCAELPDEHL